MMCFLLHLFFVFFTSCQTFAQKWDRFEVFWNVPSRNCFRGNISIPLEKYGIRVNKGHEFYGESVVTLYERKFGLYPYFKNNSDPSTAVNGGIPQRVDLLAHLKKVQKDIEAAIPDSGFNGLAVLDFEEWRPLWSLNWGTKRVYKSESVKYVRERYPHLSNKSARKLATSEFNKAAANLMVQTIRLGEKMRPFAKWGFYGFPYCNYDAGKLGEFECNEKFRKHNDRLHFVMREGNALYPSIYLGGRSENDKNFRYVQAVLKEAKRIASKFEVMKATYAFTRMEYQPYKNPFDYYIKKDICNTLKQSNDLGLQGAIIWSTSEKMTYERCRNIADYVETQYGPYVEVVKKYAARCSRKKCFRRGQCVLEPQLKCSSYNELIEYRCECDHLFFGKHCERHRHFPWLYNWKIPDSWRGFRAI